MQPMAAGLGLVLKQRTAIQGEPFIISGLLPFRIPYVEFAGEDYSNCHHAVGFTPPAPPLKSGDDWYKWYGEITPDQNEVAKVRKTYKAYLKPGL